MTEQTRKTIRLRRKPLTITLAGFGLALAFSAAPVDAHLPSTQGTTSVTPNHGAPGATIKATAAAAQPGTQYSLMFADPSQVQSFEQGGGQMGHKEACGHGSPIAGPFNSDASGNIGEVEGTIPPSSSGRALVCFETTNSLTKPVDFTVEGGSQPMPMQPPYGR